MLLEAGKRALPDVAKNVDRLNSTISKFGTIAAALRNEIKAAAPDAVEPAIRIVG